MFQVAHDADTKILKNREKNHVYPQLLITHLLENHNLSCRLSHEKQHNNSFDGTHLCRVPSMCQLPMEVVIYKHIPSF